MASSACSLESSLYCCSILYAIDAHRETIAPVVIQSRDSNRTCPTTEAPQQTAIERALNINVMETEFNIKKIWQYMADMTNLLAVNKILFVGYSSSLWFRLVTMLHTFLTCWHTATGAAARHRPLMWWGSLLTKTKGDNSVHITTQGSD